ncbi:MAG: Gfo/Idh/MocA family oxidoreductase [Alphaproteobacteria bacterium]|nr:Gfo/Idh/MocA family oxidoreductase [Alphaproteobacteria bacterium]
MIDVLKNTPRVALIGCGAWGKNLARNFAELGALTGVCDTDTRKAKVIALEHKIEAIDEDQVFTHPNVDAVVISSLAPLHASQAERALKAGKHVYIEKPMALSVKDAQNLCALAKDRKRVLMVGHLLQYHPAFMALKERLSELGPLKHIYATRLALGRFRRQEGVLWDLASHDISLILALAQSKPKTIEAVGQAFLTPGKPASALLTLTFPNNLTAHIHASWLSPFKEQKLVVIGEKGIAVFDDRKPLAEKLLISKDCFEWEEDQPQANDGFKSSAVLLPEFEPLRHECLHFLTCIQEGTEPLTSGEEGLRVTEVLEAAEKSLQEKFVKPGGCSK